MRLVLFLGSGVSLESGLPSVETISKRLLQPDRGPSEIDRVTWLLRLLEKIDRHTLATIAPYKTGDHHQYTGAIYRQTTTYEDLFYLADQIVYSGMGLLDDTPAAALIDLIEREAEDGLKGSTHPARVVDLYHLAQDARTRIETMVASLLPADDVTGLDLIVELAHAKEIDRLDIVTLNHDTLVEQLLASHEIPYEDGFGAPDGDVRWFEPDTYEGDARIRLVKPHGSIDWYAFDYRGRERMARLRNGRQDAFVDHAGRTLRRRRSTPSFLSGVNKVVRYNQSIFAEMFYWLHHALRNNDRVVMSGYGWGDTGINLRLAAWLDARPANRLVLLHRDPGALRNRSPQINEALDAWMAADRVVPIAKWMSDVSLADLRPFLAP